MLTLVAKLEEVISPVIKGRFELWIVHKFNTKWKSGAACQHANVIFPDDWKKGIIVPDHKNIKTKT